MNVATLLGRKGTFVATCKKSRTAAVSSTRRDGPSSEKSASLKPQTDFGVSQIAKIIGCLFELASVIADGAVGSSFKMASAYAQR